MLSPVQSAFRSLLTLISTYYVCKGTGEFLAAKPEPGALVFLVLSCFPQKHT